MADILYPWLVLIVAVLGLTFGFRRGFTGQISYLLGCGFGIVCARVFTPRYTSDFESWIKSFYDSPFTELIANLACASCIYLFVFVFFFLTTKILRGALSIIEVGIFNRMLGAFFSLFCWLILLSIILNLTLFCNPESGLLKYEKSDDGNMVSAVMAIAPSFLGCCGADDFAHKVQLQKAATIS